jgi:hypothetical protein
LPTAHFRPFDIAAETPQKQDRRNSNDRNNAMPMGQQKIHPFPPGSSKIRRFTAARLKRLPSAAA